MTTDHTTRAAGCPSREVPVSAHTDGLAANAPTPASGCCGGPPRIDTSACCALDEAKMSSGEAGCGCRAATEHPCAPL